MPGEACDHCLKALQFGGTEVGGVRLTACVHKFADVVVDLRLDPACCESVVHQVDGYLGIEVRNRGENMAGDLRTFDETISFLDDFTQKKRWLSLSVDHVPSLFKGMTSIWHHLAFYACSMKLGRLSAELLAYHAGIMYKAMSSDMKLEMLAEWSQYLNHMLLLAERYKPGGFGYVRVVLDAYTFRLLGSALFHGLDCLSEADLDGKKVEFQSTLSQVYSACDAFVDSYATIGRDGCTRVSGSRIERLLMICKLEERRRDSGLEWDSGLESELDEWQSMMDHAYCREVSWHETTNQDCSR